jgi:hypothetical protein
MTLPFLQYDIAVSAVGVSALQYSILDLVLANLYGHDATRKSGFLRSLDIDLYLRIAHLEVQWFRLGEGIAVSKSSYLHGNRWLGLDCSFISCRLVTS